MTTDLFYKLFFGGNYSKPYLIKFECDGLDTLCFINDTENLTYDGDTYLASTFKYTPPDLQMKGGSLTITLKDNGLINFIENADYTMKITVTGVLNEDGTVSKIAYYKHQFCTMSWGTNMQLEVQLNPDDRLSMTFPPYTFDTDNNRGGN